MSEKLCLQWNDFKENVNSAFSRLRNDNDFTDVTLACEDGQHLEAHKVILAASSPVFEKILQKSKHPHPLIYLRGFQSKDLASILDFLYFGEANVFQESLDLFLAIADEIKLKGLTGQTSRNKMMEEQEKPQHSESVTKSKDLALKSTSQKDPIPTASAFEKPSSMALSISEQFDTNLQALDEKVKSMMEKGQKMIKAGKGQKRSWLCKVCGKEGILCNIRDHIEAQHLEGVIIPCEYCDKTFSTRINLNHHKNRSHK